MTIDLIKQFEAVPTAYPEAPDGLSDEAAALEAGMLWQRIEAYTAHRFSAREVVWTLIGNGGDQFHPPLAPIVSYEADLWVSGAWVPQMLLSGPVGLCLPINGTYRITAQVGANYVPAVVSAAFRRLAEYMADDPGRVGTTSFTDKIGPLEESVNRAPTWLARAMQYSGAADLLRPYRRA